MKFLEAVTPDALRERVREIAAARPAIQSALDHVSPEGLAEWIQTQAPTYDALRHLLPPAPPLNLRSITGPPDVPEFLRRGAEDINYMFELHDAHAPPRAGKLRVLDFGCGCGRLSRFVGMSDSLEAFGSDANPNHVDWCTVNLQGVVTRRNGFMPPLQFDAGSMDFVYALSVFTHLPRDAAAAWFRDLARVLAPRGILIITTHGYPALATITASQVHQDMFQLSQQDAISLAERLPREEYIFIPYAAEVVKLANVGAIYGNTFMDVSRVHPLWDDVFELIEHVPGGLSKDWQDALVLRKRD